MPSDLPLVPIHLWNWGIQHRVGQLKQVSEKALHVALLPKVKATLSDLGLKMFGVFYNCPEIYKQGWMHRKNLFLVQNHFKWLMIQVMQK